MPPWMLMYINEGRMGRAQTGVVVLISIHSGRAIMKLSFKRVAALALLATAFSLPAIAQEEEQVFGRQLMTQEELQEHRRMMQSLDTPEARQEYRQQHHQRMLERARERGVTLPEEPGRQGKGQGKGQGQGMGQGQGQGMKNGMGKGGGKQ